YENKIFFAPFYYQALPHNYADEVQYRGPGGRKKMDTRHPVGHRQTLGASAQRFGEMEVWSQEGFGAAGFLQDRLCVASDAEPLVVCKTCSNIIDEKLIIEGERKVKAELVCANPQCRKQSAVLVRDVPFVLQTWAQLLAALGISTTFHTAPKQTGFFPDPRQE